MTQKRAILVVDDDEMVRKIIVAMIAPEDYQVLQARSGEHALEIALAQQIDGFLVDMEMPGMGGIEVCRRLRALEQYKVTPIIFVTGVGESNGVPKAFEAGCNDLISKPMNAVVLRARLRGHLEKMDYFRQLEATRRMLNRYVSLRTKEVVKAASEAGIPDAPPAERNLTILFTDMRDFTASSEGMDPNQLFTLVSALLAEQVVCIHEFGGYVDKFGGDGVMAVFDSPDMVVQSCLCALTILDRSRLKHSSQSDKMWQFGIGIHTGNAVVGNIGSVEHMDYSVIGNVVNLAARLCGHAGATAAVVSQAVHDAAADDPRLHFHSERKVSIRGVKESVTVFTLSRPSESIIP